MKKVIIIGEPDDVNIIKAMAIGRSLLGPEVTNNHEVKDLMRQMVQDKEPENKQTTSTHYDKYGKPLVNPGSKFHK